MKLKLTVILATFVVTMGLLLGASTAQAVEVIYEGDNATGIENLEVDGVLYHVEFLYDSAENIYGESLTFDFPDAEKVVAASSAVRAALNSVEAVTTVGPQGDGANEYVIGFGLFEFFEGFQFVAGTQDYYDDVDADWAEDTQVLIWPASSATWADFTEVPGPTIPAPVPATGQTTSYETGDDGDLQKGVPWPEQRFTDNDDGTVTDNLTGLIWLQDATCGKWEPAPGVPTVPWRDAVEAANDLSDGDCGLSDGSVRGEWRLPNIRELTSLIDYSNFDPALPSDHPFIDAEGAGYWTSTTDPMGQGFKFRVDFLNSIVRSAGQDSGEDQRVWPVRGGN